MSDERVIHGYTARKREVLRELDAAAERMATDRDEARTERDLAMSSAESAIADAHTLVVSLTLARERAAAAEAREGAAQERIATLELAVDDLLDKIDNLVIWVQVKERDGHMLRGMSFDELLAEIGVDRKLLDGRTR